MWHLDPNALINTSEVDAFKIMSDADLGKTTTDVSISPHGTYWIVAIFKSGNKVELVDLGEPISFDKEYLSEFFQECYAQLKTFAKDLYASGSIRIDDTTITLT